MQTVDYAGNPIRESDSYLDVVPVENVEDRVAPRQVGVGMARGQQTFLGPDGSKVVIGLVPDDPANKFGISFFDEDGNLVSSYIGATTYVYDPNNDTNVMQIGKLPDETYGFAVAKEGTNVEDIYD